MNEMLSGKYDFLIDNMHIAEIIATFLLIAPIFLLFFNKKYLYSYYAVSIVANLPLIFEYVFHFSYEFIIGLMIVILFIKDIIKQKSIRYVIAKECVGFIIMLIAIMGVNLVMSLFNFNKEEFFNRIFIYLVNLFLLFIYTHYFKESEKIKCINYGIMIGGVILVVSMLVELIYGHYHLGVRNMRPAGLLLDPNVCAFALNLTLALSFLERKEGKFINDLILVFLRVILIFGVFLTVSRSGYLGTLFILIFYLVHYSKGKKRWIVQSLSIVLIIMYLIFQSIITDFIKDIYSIIDLKRIIPYSDVTPPTNNGPIDSGSNLDYDYSNARLTLIIAAIKVFGNNFLTGVGIGNVISKINSITNLKMNAHNLYLQLLAESGIVMLFTLLLFSYYFFVLISKVKSRYKHTIYCVFGVIIIESFFNHNLLNLNLIFLVISIILGLVNITSINRIDFVIGKGYKRFKKKSYNLNM